MSSTSHDTTPGASGQSVAGAGLPVVRMDFSTLEDIRRLEKSSYGEALPFPSTGAILEYAARTFGTAPAILYQENAVPDEAPLKTSFEALWRDVLAAANLFRGLGIRRDDPVALLVPNVPSAHVALWGAQLAGCAFPINFLLDAEHVAQLLRTTGTRVVVTLAPSATLPLNTEVRKAVALAECVEHVLEIDPDERHPGTGSFQHRLREAESLAGKSHADLLAEVDGDSLAALFHTGGTTGLPKILRHIQRNEAHTSWFGAMYYAMRQGDVVLNGFPLFHVAGTFVYGLAPLAAGAALFLPTLTGMRNQQFVGKLWTFAERNDITHLGCVPTVLAALLGVPRPPGSGDTVRLALTGGSPLPNELAARFEEQHHIPVRNIFGMTECAGIVSIEPASAPRRAGSVGVRLPFSEVVAVPLGASLDDTLTEFCKPGEAGVLAIRGPHVSAGYIDASRNEGTFTRDGWLISGDLGYIDEAGYIYLTGRSKDLIIRGGHNIEPGMVEEAFLKHPAVSTCAVVGEPDGYAGELPVAFITLKEPGQRQGLSALSAEGILSEVARHISERPAVPKKVVILDSLPTTPVGKIFKPSLRVLAASSKISEIIASLGLQDAARVSCTAEANGIVARVAAVRPLNDEESALLAQALGSLPIEVRYP